MKFESIFDVMIFGFIAYLFMVSFVFFMRHDLATVDSFVKHPDKIFFLKSVEELKSFQSQMLPVEK